MSSAKRRPRILFVSKRSDLSGPTNVLLTLLKELRKIFEVAVLLGGDGPLLEALEREDIPSFQITNFSKWSIPTIYRLIKRERFDLVYGNGATPNSSRIALFAAKLARVPYICHVHEMGGWGREKKISYLKYADAAIAVSNACAESVSRLVDPDRRYVVHNGVTLPRRELGKDAAKADLMAEAGLSNNGPVIVCLGRVSPRKGQHYGIEAASRIIEKVPSASFVIIGGTDHPMDQPYVKSVRSRISDFKLGGKVSLLGFRRDAQELLQGADIFLHSAESDPHPLAVLEAMAMGLPVVAFDVDGVSETVIDQETGFLVRSGDVDGLTNSVLKLIANPHLRKTFGARGRERIQNHFSAEETGEKIATIISQTIAKRGSFFDTRLLGFK